MEKFSWVIYRYNQPGTYYITGYMQIDGELCHLKDSQRLTTLEGALIHIKEYEKTIDELKEANKSLTDLVTKKKRK